MFTVYYVANGIKEYVDSFDNEHHAEKLVRHIAEEFDNEDDINKVYDDYIVVNEGGENV